MLMETVYYDNQVENVRKTPNTLPIFLVSGKDDPVGDMGIGVKKVHRLYKRAGVKDVVCKLYEKDRHELINELDKEKVFKNIVSWMEKRRKRS